jgi:uncharacterized alkaline shock family protein YloU
VTAPLAETQRRVAPQDVPQARRAGEERGDPEQRGVLVIDARVVEKVAAQAVRQVTSASGAARRVLGITVGELTESSDARVQAYVDGNLATVTVALGVRWPASITAVVDDVRRRIHEDVARITATDVRRIDIEVVNMAVPPHHRARVR